MINSSVVRFAVVPLAVALFGAVPVGEVKAQSRHQSSPGFSPGHHGGVPASFFAGGYAQPFRASSALAMSGVSVSVSPHGGVGVNIVNLGASQSLAGFGAGFGMGYGPPGFSAGLAGVPGFSGGSLFNWLGMNGLNVQVGGGSSGGGGVSVNIANIALSSNVFFGGGLARGYYQGPRRSRPDLGGGGDGGNSGGGGAGDGGGEGGGAY
jgi:hypothetical protein